MKEYVMKFTGSGDKYDFNDKEDRNSFRGFLSFMKNKGVEKFVMVIKPYSDSVTNKQENLWAFITSFVARETGNDIKTVEETINSENRDVSEIDKEEFQILIEKAFSICKEFFNVELEINKYGNIEIKN